jgi:RNA:NAD 2'-phosphotransferase (TPT1/KptA family)
LPNVSDSPIVTHHYRCMSLAVHCHRRRLPGPLLQLTAAILDPLVHQTPHFTCRRRYLLAACANTSNIPTKANSTAGGSRDFHSPASVVREKERHDRRQQLLEGRIARTVYWLLTHGGDQGGLNVQPDGYIPIHELLKHPSLHNADIRTIEKIINDDGQQRFQLVYLSDAFKSDGSVPANHWYIRTRRGHTIPGIRIDLKRIFTPSQVTMAVHWTTPEQWAEISQHGLRKPKDEYIRFLQSTDVTRMRDQLSVVVTQPSTTRKRRGSQSNPITLPPQPPQPASELHRSILIRLDMQKALAAGITFYLDYAPPGHLRKRQRKHPFPPPVIVTKGNEMGVIGPELFQSVEVIETSVKRVKIEHLNEIPDLEAPTLVVEEAEAATSRTRGLSMTRPEETTSSALLSAQPAEEPSIPTESPRSLPFHMPELQPTPVKTRSTAPLVAIPSSSRSGSLSSRLRAASASTSPSPPQKQNTVSQSDEPEPPPKSFRPQLQQGVRLLDRLKASSATPPYSPSSSYSTSTGRTSSDLSSDSRTLGHRSPSFVVG